MSATKDHGQRAEDLLGQVSVTADKALEAATVHAILHLADQVAALGRELPVYLERLADGWVETGGPAAAGFMPPVSNLPPLAEEDLKFEYFTTRGQPPHEGPRGVRVIHLPTGWLSESWVSGASQLENTAAALEALRKRLPHPDAEPAGYAEQQGLVDEPPAPGKLSAAELRRQAAELGLDLKGA